MPEAPNPAGNRTARREATPQEARALAHPDRWRIIRLTLDAALTNKELAERLGRDPATTLHHVRTLVATGFLEAQVARRGARGAREIPYRSTGKSWTLDIGEAKDDYSLAIVDAFRAELLESPPAERHYARLGLRLTRAQREALEERLDALVEELASMSPADGGEPCALFVAVHSRPEALQSKSTKPRTRRQRGR
jgi:predicted ArsR family transcriptional regulator